jgi:uncharacterized delta-60 repeat protein
MAAALLPVAAQAAPSDLDSTFGSGGFALAASGRTTVQSDPIVQPSGKVVVVGVNAANKAVIERFNTNGTLDTSFGTGGEVVTDLTPAFGRVAVASTPSGTFQIATGTESGGGKITLERFSVDGVLQGSKVTATVTGALVWPTSAVIKSDGTTYVGAKFDCGSGTYCFGVAKFKGSGLDTGLAGVGGFTSKGYVTKAIGSYSRALDIALTTGSDGADRITLVGTTGYPGLSGDAVDTAIARWKGDGSLDTSFDGDGVKTVDLSGAAKADWANGVVVTSSGAITVAGYSNNKGMVARFTSTGALDSSFGSAGVVRGGFAPSTLNYTAADVVLDSSARPLIAGRTVDPATNVAKWTMSRLTTTGAFDASFASGGSQQYTPCAASNADGPFGIAFTTTRTYFSGGCNADDRTAVARLLSGPAFTGNATLNLSTSSEAAGRNLILTDNQDPSKVLGAVDLLQGTGLKFNGLRFNGLRFNGLRFNGLKFVGLRF